MKKITTFFFVFMLTIAGFAQGHETFDNYAVTGNSYADGVFTGQDGSTWSYVQSRGDMDLNGSALMLGRNQSPDAELTSGILHNGLGTLTFSYMQAYSTDVQLEVYVNNQLVYTATTSSENGVQKTTNAIPVNVSGDFTLRFYNPNGGQVVVDDIIWTALGNQPTVAITSPHSNQQFFPWDTPTLAFNVNNFSISSSASAADGDGYVQYTVDQTGVVDYFSADPVTLSGLAVGSHAVTVELVDNSGNSLTPAVTQTVSFTMVEVTAVNDIGSLRTRTLGEYYTLTGEVVLTYQQSFRGQKYIQDASGAILIDDADGVITTVYNRHDGITGIRGELREYNGSLQFIPIEDPGAATSTGNFVQPEVLTIDEFIADPVAYESELIAFENVAFSDADGTLTFAPGADYALTDGTTPTTVRTDFYDADYIGEIIPQGTLDAVVGIAAHFNTTGQIFMRDTSDLSGDPLGVKTPHDMNVKLYPNPATSYVVIQLDGNAEVVVYSILGQEVRRQEVTNAARISVEDLEAGLYLLKIEHKGQVMTKKLLIN